MNKNVMTKAVFIGEAKVGKTAIISQYQHQAFIEQYRTTIGAEFSHRIINADDKVISLQIWDTAGQEKFASLGATFYRGAQCCVIVFDVTDQKSFQMLDFWREEFITQGRIEEPEDFPFVIIGNKVDLLDEEKKIDKRNDAEQWCESRGNMIYIETSCKDQNSINSAFQVIASRSLHHIQRKEGLQNRLISQYQGQSGTKQGCSC